MEQADRDASAIYATVLQRLATVDSSFEPGFLRRLLVIDHPAANTGREEAPRSHAFSPGIRRALESAVDLPVAFVYDERIAIGAGTHVRDRARVRLGPIRESAGRVAVDASLYVGNLGETSSTYVLEKGDSGWQIVGRTGGAVA